MATETFQDNNKISSEVVIGIVSPVGTSLTNTIESLKREFTSKKFNVHHIKISNEFRSLAELIGYTYLSDKTKYDRIDTYIKFGNFLSSNVGPKCLSALAISMIADQRKENLGAEVQGSVFIVDQLKREEEIELLRELYGSRFLQISVYSARDVRVDNLARQIAHGHRKSVANSFRSQAEALVVRDEDEAGVEAGQKVGKIFQLADVVFNDDMKESDTQIDKQVCRFVELLFGHNAYSPTRAEYGMYLAHSAALRSLDLSRQVGAAIFRCTGEIASLGSNEVPKAGGGTYWADDGRDAREYVLKKDSNDFRKRELLDEVLDILAIGQEKLSEEQKKKLDKSQFMDALEYGRIIHAEMSAISDAARLGISLQNATLYCTTFPCHMCSKHIVASGISKVIFLEPYPKSLTSDLHSDSVKIEGSSRGAYEDFNSVDFVPFYGITPRRYREFFYRSKRKSGGEFQVYRGGVPKLMMAAGGPYYTNRESEVIQLFRQHIDRLIDDKQISALPPGETLKPTEE